MGNILRDLVSLSAESRKGFHLMQRPGPLNAPMTREGILHRHHLDEAILIAESPDPVSQVMGKGW